MMRIVLFLLSMLFSSLASAFVFPQPIVKPNFPTAYPSADSAPAPAGSGSSSGQGIDKSDVGHVAGVICILSPCTSSVAMAPVGIIPPAGWTRDSSTGAIVPPASKDTLPPGAGSDCSAKIHNNWDPYVGNISVTVTKVTDVGYGTLQAEVQCVGTINPPYSNTIVTWGYYNFSATSDPCGSGSTISLSTGMCSPSKSNSPVTKPAGTPCQVIMTNGMPSWDTSNPECASRGAGPYWTDADGNKESIDTGLGTFSVVSKDGNSGTDMGPANANTLPVKTWQNVTDTAGVPHRLETTTTLDSNGNVTGHSYKIDGNPVTLDVFNNTLAGQPYNPSSPSNANNNPASSPSTSGGGSGSAQSITCETVGTCGVAQDSTLKDVAAKTGTIQTSLSDFFKNFTTAVAIPQLYTPSTTTAQSALQDFSNQIKATPIITSVTGFFDVNFQGGACPTWTIPVVNVMGLSIGGIEIDQFCTPTAYRVYSIIAVVTLVVCGFFGFRVAVDG